MVGSNIRSRGLALVELCMVLPLFLFLFLGIIDLGRYFFVQHTIQFATREGMRLALVGKRLPGEDGALLSREDSIIQTIRKKASIAVDPSSLSIYVYPVTADYGDPTGWDSSEPNAGNPGVYMRVRCRYTYPYIVLGAFLSREGALIEAQGTYRNELFDA